MRIIASAPGKVVLLGEYAVLAGAPALVMAVDRRASVELVESDGPYSRVTAPGYSTRELRFRSAGAALQWVGLGDTGREYDLAVRVIDDILPAAERTWPNVDLTLRTDAFFADVGGSTRRVKLGLGSSAALTVALAAALASHVGLSPAAEDEAWMNRLWELHRGYQAGYGSGLDIAASVHGGVIEYRLSSRGAAPHVAKIEPVTLPGAFVWTGSSAATPAFLRRFDHWRSAAPQRFAPIIAELHAVAAGGIGAFRNSDVAGFVAALGKYASALEDLAKQAGIDIFSPAHRRLLELARSLGAVYKPCGAGGGDIGIALHPDASALRSFMQEAEALGYAMVEVDVADKGLEILRRQT